MAKKKSKSSAASAKRPQAPAKKKSSAGMWVVGTIAVLAIVAVIAIIANGNGQPAAGSSASATVPTTAPTGAAVPADEQRYIGRLLPAGYTEAPVAAAASYTQQIPATPITVKTSAKTTTFSVADVVARKITSFTYTKADGTQVPMVAYVKPSGKLWVGVSYCIPCKGSEQAIDADGTLRCVACGTKRDLETGVGISGACRLYPLDELPVTVAGGTVTIQNAAINNWTAQPLDRKVGA